MRTLFGVHSHGFPNLFIMNDMQSSFRFNLTDVMQVQGDHIAAWIDHVRRNGYQSVDVRIESEEYRVQEVIKFRGSGRRSSQCTPGYFNFEGEDRRRQHATYNGGFNRYCSEVEAVAANLQDHYVFAKTAKGDEASQ